MINSGLEEIKARLIGSYLEFYSRYDFTIEGTSINAGYLGLSDVATGSDVSALRSEPASNAYVIGYSGIMNSADEAVRPPPYERIAPNDSMVNGVLSDDITLDLSINGGTYAGVVTVLKGSTDGTLAGTTANAGIADIVRDINNALEATLIPGYPGVHFSDVITVRDERGVIVFVSDYTFTLSSEATDNLEQLGFGVATYNSALTDMDYQVTATTNLINSGVLTSGVTLVISMDDGAGGTWDTNVVIEQAETTANTGVNDLLNDIENALVSAAVLDGAGAYRLICQPVHQSGYGLRETGAGGHRRIYD